MEKKKWVYGNSQVSQAKFYTIVGTLLAALGVIVSFTEELALWQIIVVSLICAVILILMISIWAPSIFFWIWLMSKRKMLKGFKFDENHKVKIYLITIQKSVDFHDDAKDNYGFKQSVEFTYKLNFNKDIRFLEISFSFENNKKVKLDFESNIVDIAKRKNELIFSFDYDNRDQVRKAVKEDRIVPLIEGLCEMKFDLKTKELDQITFNKTSEFITITEVKK